MERYRSLLLRAGKPRSGDREALRAAMHVLNIDVARLQADLDVLKQAADLADQAAGDTPELTAAIEKAGREWEAYREESKAIAQQRQNESLKLGAAFSDLQGQRSRAHEAGNKLRVLRRTHWQVFGEPEPQPERMPGSRPVCGPQPAPDPARIAAENAKARTELPWVPADPSLRACAVGEREANEAYERANRGPRPPAADQVDEESPEVMPG